VPLGYRCIDKKLEIVPVEAETVRTIFARYLELGSMGALLEIAENEALGERHIRLLAPLAFLSPRIIAAIVNGTAPADLTVTGLAKALPYSWAKQEESIGL
jgi:hypothetical protein